MLQFAWHSKIATGRKTTDYVFHQNSIQWTRLPFTDDVIFHNNSISGIVTDAIGVALSEVNMGDNVFVQLSTVVGENTAQLGAVD